MSGPDRTPAPQTPAQVLAELRRQGLGPALEAALNRLRQDGTLGRSRPALEAADWAALEGLTGRGGPVLDLAWIDRQLQVSRFATPLVPVLEALNGGPILTAAQRKHLDAARVNAVIATVDDPAWKAELDAGRAGHPALRRAVLTGEPDVPAQLALVSRALARLRAEALPLPLLAAALTGDAHALDPGTLAHTLLSAAVPALDVTAPQENGVTSSALIANLHGPAWLSGCAGHALALPWREVTRLPDLHSRTGTVWVVENPSVFEALHDRAPQAALVCLYGMPNTATRSVLALLRQGTRLQLSTDLDYGGLSIARHLLQDLPGRDWRLWRMDAAAHALATARGSVRVTRPLSGFTGALAPLAEAVARTGLGAHHETLLPELHADLAAEEAPDAPEP